MGGLGSFHFFLEGGSDRAPEENEGTHTVTYEICFGQLCEHLCDFDGGAGRGDEIGILERIRECGSPRDTYTHTACR